MSALYVHIPFCQSRCIYCGFYSTTLLSLQDRYVDALCRELELRSRELRSHGPVATVYLGGGTPSTLSPSNLHRLFQAITEATNDGNGGIVETTMECNPDDVTDAFCSELRRLPVNRISMGAQTFNDQRLQFLHRRHSARQVSEAVERLRWAGIANISIDLMFGFPGETLADWQSDIDRALDLAPEHLSAYALMYEEGTPLFRERENKKIAELGEELERQMYELLIDRLTAAHYEHYEISNFAKLPTPQCTLSSQDNAPLPAGAGPEVRLPSPFRSRHNSAYWNQTPYIGLGAAAHSYDGQCKRSWNVADIRQYIAAIERGELPSEYEELDDNTRYNDLITTALRTREGIRLRQLSPHYRQYLLDNARRSLDAGLLTIENLPTATGTEPIVRLTRNGLFVSDDVMSDLIFA